MPNNALHRRCVDFRFMSLGLYPHLGERERYAGEINEYLSSNRFDNKSQ